MAALGAVVDIQNEGAADVWIGLVSVTVAVSAVPTIVKAVVVPKAVARIDVAVTKTVRSYIVSAGSGSPYRTLLEPPLRT